MKTFKVQTASGRILVTAVEYHRNGVAGNGFYAIQFCVSDLQYVATVFAESGNVAVLCVSDLSSRWRGDEFEDGLREAIGIATGCETSSIFV